MKGAILTGLFIFSLVLNVAVAGTLLWHFWWHAPPPPFSEMKPGAGYAEFEQIRPNFGREWRRGMMENRRKVLEKHREILDLIARDPGNPHAADKVLAELSTLRSDTERRTVARLSKIISELPPDKRDAFVSFLKDRACGGMGMGMGRGPKHPGRPDCGPPPMAPGLGPPAMPPE